MKKEFLECGKVCSAHGIRGCMKIESWCDTPRDLADKKRVFIFDGGKYNEYAVLSASVNGRGVLMSLEGISTREMAQALKNTVLYLKREDIHLADGAVLLADIIGLPVIDHESGKVYGEVVNINDGVQGYLYLVKTDTGEVIFPGIPEFVKEIDTERGVFVRTIPGFFD